MPDLIARTAGDPSPRTLESMYREIKSLEDKFNIRFEGYDDAVELLQEFANRQPTTEAVNHDLGALKELAHAELEALREFVKAKFEGNQTALDAALKTQKEASDKIEANVGKQFDNQAKTIDDLKDRINRSDGRTVGLGSAGSLILGGAIILSVLIAAASFIIART